MKKLLYFLLFLTYIACAYSTIFFLPFMYFSGIVEATGVGLGLSYSLHQEVKKYPEKQLSEYLPWGSKRDKIMVVTILLFSILVSFISDVNWHRGLAILLGISYVLLWQAMLIQFLRKYYFKNA
ncbi:hypothetical protein [Streptococcus suis]|uniref:Uncharacterized protein n=1 Tax=Streptococcus suis TaxID=1307 RepID=A0A3R8MZE2_STRSU|nr:hypothetical protein [Streptococcus suis]MBY4975591.1 hypothetical protein [Streptococcus suis]NQI35328.1 hypothetical protein [Streptococcus suis]NQI37536.1 hypothetical protein [Streptococcus suis]NQI47624.1 hypothetical protein [Streptococcus suis]QOZ89665.1 hypothetical protein D2E16_10165 [Streptococcus suis]